MLPDIKIKDYYLNYIHNAMQDIEEYGEKIKKYEIDIKDYKEYITKNINDITNIYGIDLNSYENEWINEKYNSNETLYKKVIEFINQDIITEGRNTLLFLLKYLICLKNIKKAKEIYDIAEKRNNITLKKFKEYVTIYYEHVHKVLLEGFGYKYSGGIGTILINYWRVNKDVTENRVNFQETRKAKKALIEQGLKPYDEQEAKRYKELGLEYDGIPYIVRQTDNFFFEITFIDSMLFTERTMDFDKAQFINHKLKGMGYKEIADKFVTKFDDIYKLKVGLTHKINISHYKFPNNYLNFIRNASAEKYEYPTHNSEIG